MKYVKPLSGGKWGMAWWEAFVDDLRYYGLKVALYWTFVS
jgi:hypothetical protein